GFAQDGEVLNGLVVDLLEAEGLAAVRIVVRRDTVEASAPGISGRRSPVEPNGALRVDVVRVGAKAGQHRGSVSGLEGVSVAWLRRPLGKLQAPTQKQEPPSGADSEQRREVRLLEAVVLPVLLGGVHAQPVEADLRSLSPAA